MKRLFVVLVALIGFVFGVNAQSVYVSSVTQSISSDGKSVEIRVTVKGELDTPTAGCRLGIKVCPKTRNLLDALFINCEYGNVEFSCINRGCTTKYGEGTVTFRCSVKQNETAPRCGAYDFDVTITNNGCK